MTENICTDGPSFWFIPFSLFSWIILLNVLCRLLSTLCTKRFRMQHNIPKLYLQDISINFFIEYFCVVLKANRLWLSSSSLPWQGTSLLVLTFFFFFTIKHMLFFFLSKNQTSTHPHNRSLKNWVLLKTSNHLVWKWNKMLNLYRNAK